jgi:hypothetical protein
MERIHRVVAARNGKRESGSEIASINVAKPHTAIEF